MDGLYRLLDGEMPQVSATGDLRTFLIQVRQGPHEVMHFFFRFEEEVAGVSSSTENFLSRQALLPWAQVHPCFFFFPLFIHLFHFNTDMKLAD